VQNERVYLENQRSCLMIK